MSANPFFMLQHYVARIKYRPISEVESYFADKNYEKHLDTLGQGIALSVAMLPDDAKAENEVRLIFSLNLNEEWTSQNVQIFQDFVKIPFDWTNALNNIVMGPHVQEHSRDDLRSQLRLLDIECGL
jgi:hypothetical protein